jgi:hypothetical protein
MESKLFKNEENKNHFKEEINFKNESKNSIKIEENN